MSERAKVGTKQAYETDNVVR